ncbi:amidohydrolase [Nannocystis radixulma]|uniref:Amidohydrolase n=1 Tax=Nannocystis radixulma TaxID=2995305 RepID=A0ABT5BF92_9BACT|nr:amidohydrolase [Nannocystis radixulma]MDC0672808.1 amidohydrolase [Nannocystis radixulma]
MTVTADADIILFNGRITTMDPRAPEVTAAAIRDGRFLAVGDDAAVLGHGGAGTRKVDLGGRRAIPGLIDSHLHLIRGGLTYNSELRWDGVASLAEALRRLRAQAQITPPPQWVRVVGGWSEFQFAERRMPTLDELNAAAPDTPVFVLHLYSQALLNRAALRAVGYTRDTPDPPGGVIERDRHGEPTGLLVAKPNAWILYATLARGPRLDPDQQRNSTRHFMRELNRLGITGAIDAGGGFQQYPEHYQIIEELAAAKQLTVRVAYNLFTQRPGQELDDFSQWSQQVTPGRGDEFYRLNGAGEMLVYSAADFEDFLEPRPDLPAHMEGQLTAVVEHLVAHRWPFRLHATYDESISRMLDVFEAVNRKIPFAGLRWFFDHAETVSAKSIDRIAALGGGIAIQHRMAYQGEHFLRRYGPELTAEAPPVRRMLAAGIPVGGGTDATRVASYNPWVGLGWLVSGRSVGGTELLGPGSRLSREQALRLYTAGNGWFSGEDGQRGLVAAGQLGDLAVLSDDYFAVPEHEIRALTSVLTVVGGDVVHASGEFGGLAPPPPPFSPDWAPPKQYGGYDPGAVARALHHRAHHHHHHHVGLACPCAVF